MQHGIGLTRASANEGGWKETPGRDRLVATRWIESGMWSVDQPCARTASLRLSGITRYSAGSIELVARPWVIDRRVVV